MYNLSWYLEVRCKRKLMFWRVQFFKLPPRNEIPFHYISSLTDGETLALKQTLLKMFSFFLMNSQSTTPCVNNLNCTFKVTPYWCLLFRYKRHDYRRKIRPLTDQAKIKVCFQPDSVKRWPTIPLGSLRSAIKWLQI